MTARDVTVGDLVKKGQRLAALDPTVVQLQVASAQADVANAQAQLVNAVATQTRQQTLAQGGNAAQSQLDAAIANAETAKARVTQTLAALQKAKDQLSYSELQADYDGVVTAWTAEVGQVVTAGQSVVTIAKPDEREAVFDVPDSLIGTMGLDEVYTVALLIDTSFTAKGRVRELAPQSDASTRTRRVRLSLEDPPLGFRLGTTVSVSLLRPSPMRIELPASAILEKDGKNSVWVVAAPGTVDLREVTLTAREGLRVTLSAGLAKGDRIVTAGVHSLKAGQAVKLSEQQP
jgi:RND family efflux transporter MFP subunit